MLRKELKCVLKSAARRYPTLAEKTRPLSHFLIAIALRANPTWAASVLRQRYSVLEQRLKAKAKARLLQKAVACQAARGIGTNASGRRIVMLVVSNIWIDPRVEREARALAAAGYEVEVICPDLAQPEGSCQSPDWGNGVRVRLLPAMAADFAGVRPGFEAGYLFEAAMAAADDKDLLAFHGHDLNTCLAALAAAQMTGAHMVADFHEWTSENVHWDTCIESWAPYPATWKAELQALEARIMREASRVVTVCDSIADALSIELGAGRRPEVIRNIPSLVAVPTRQYPPLKEQFGLAPDTFVLLYQGGTGPTRFLEPVIEALALAPKCTLIIRGPSLDLFGEGYRLIARRGGYEDRLVIAPAVPSQDVVAAARGADAGIYTVLGVGKNFILALPNKIFEYAAAGLPVLTADYPEARNMVETHQIGQAFDPNDPASIAAAINRLIDDPAFANTCRSNTETALKTLDADSEWQKLVALYDNLPRTSVAKTKV